MYNQISNLISLTLSPFSLSSSSYARRISYVWEEILSEKKMTGFEETNEGRLNRSKLLCSVLAEIVSGDRPFGCPKISNFKRCHSSRRPLYYMGGHKYPQQLKLKWLIEYNSCDIKIDNFINVFNTDIASRSALCLNYLPPFQ